MIASLLPLGRGQKQKIIFNSERTYKDKGRRCIVKSIRVVKEEMIKVTVVSWYKLLQLKMDKGRCPPVKVK